MITTLSVYGSKQLVRELILEYITLYRYYNEYMQMGIIIDKLRNEFNEVKMSLEKEEKWCREKNKIDEISEELKKGGFFDTLLHELDNNNLILENTNFEMNMNEFNTKEDIENLKQLYKKFPLKYFWWLIPKLKMSDEVRENLGFIPLDTRDFAMHDGKAYNKPRFDILLVIMSYIMVIPLVLASVFITKNILTKSKLQRPLPLYKYTVDDLRKTGIDGLKMCHSFANECFAKIENLNEETLFCKWDIKQIKKAFRLCNIVWGDYENWKSQDYVRKAIYEYDINKNLENLGKIIIRRAEYEGNVDK